VLVCCLGWPWPHSLRCGVSFWLLGPYFGRDYLRYCHVHDSRVSSTSPLLSPMYSDGPNVVNYIFRTMVVMSCVGCMCNG
jgi:hypothetical protein